MFSFCTTINLLHESEWLDVECLCGAAIGFTPGLARLTGSAWF